MMDTSLLSREQKLRLLDVIDEKKRRIRESKSVYKPNPGQLPVHKSTKSLRCVFSGNGAGKTALAVNEALWFAQGWNPVTLEFTRVPARVVILLDHPEKVADLWLPEIQKWTNLREDQLHKRGKPYVSRISFDTGSEFIFMFHDQAPLIFESIEIDVLIADEPPPRAVYIALRRGARRKGRKPRFLLIGTPISAAWMRKEILDPWSKGELLDCDCFTFGTSVNEANLADGYVAQFSAILSEKERRIRLHGEFFDLEGLALSHLFAQESHIIEPFEWDPAWPCVIAIDPHTAKPHHAVMIGTDPEGNLFYLKEVKRKCFARDFKQDLREMMAGHRVVDIVCDSLGSSEYTSGEGFSSFIEVLRDDSDGRAILVRATTWDEKQDEDFIQRIQSALVLPEEPNNCGDYIPKLRIWRGCTGIISDIENVQWVKHRNIDEYKPKLDITNKDYLSCLKYALATNLTFNKAKAKVYYRTKGTETYGVDDRRQAATPWGQLRKRNGKSREDGNERTRSPRHGGRYRPRRGRNGKSAEEEF